MLRHEQRTIVNDDVYTMMYIYTIVYRDSCKDKMQNRPNIYRGTIITFFAVQM